MPVVVKKIGSKYYAVEPKGGKKKGRGHTTRAKALKQVQAINISLRKKGSK